MQGTDARLSGHFTYSTTPAFMDLRLAPALRCTNRSEVQVGWQYCGRLQVIGVAWMPSGCSAQQVGTSALHAGSRLCMQGSLGQPGSYPMCCNAMYAGLAGGVGHDQRRVRGLGQVSVGLHWALHWACRSMHSDAVLRSVPLPAATLPLSLLLLMGSNALHRLPELSAEEKKRLLSPEDPVWARPAGFDARAWTGVR